MTVGFKLVGAAIHPHWSRLTHLQHRVLVVMANTALDHPRNGQPRAIFWGGWGYISLCIFGTDTPSDGQIHSIQRAVSALIKAGAVERVEAALGGRRARYRLILDEFKMPEVPPLEPETAGTSGTTSANALVGTSGTSSSDESVGTPGTNSDSDPAGTSGTNSDSDPAGTSDTNSAGTSCTTSSRVAGTSGTTKLVPHVPAEEELRNKEEEETSGGDINQVSAQPELRAREIEVTPLERCTICGRTERRCRAAAAKHGNHPYTPRQTA